MLKQTTVALALALSAVSYSASAEFIKSDAYVLNDNKAVLDTQTGLEWLSLSETADDSISKYMNLDNGWRLATQDEVQQYIYNIFDVQESDFVDGRMTITSREDNISFSVINEIMGQTYSTNTWSYAQGAVYDEGSNSLKKYGVMISKYISTSYPTYVFSDFELSSQNIGGSSRYSSVFLVSEGGASYSSLNDAAYSQIQSEALAAKDVSAPFAFSALGLSLAALVRLKKRKVA
jgi:hypothetical protein